MCALGPSLQWFCHERRRDLQLYCINKVAALFRTLRVIISASLNMNTLFLLRISKKFSELGGKIVGKTLGKKICHYRTRGVRDRKY